MLFNMEIIRTEHMMNYMIRISPISPMLWGQTLSFGDGYNYIFYRKLKRTMKVKNDNNQYVIYPMVGFQWWLKTVNFTI
jgi:hypothetical protein